MLTTVQRQALKAAILADPALAALPMTSGTGSDASPGTMTFEGALTSEDVQAARELQ